MRADADRLFKEATELRKQVQDLDPSKVGNPVARRKTKGPPKL